MYLEIKESVLSNGIRVVTNSIPHVGTASIGFWIGVGGRYESKKLSGISHFIEHLLFKGTTTRSAKDISEAIEGKGGYFNAFTQEDATCYYARICSLFIDDTLELLSDMYLNPTFDSEDIEKERRVIVEEMMMYRDQPQHIIQEKLTEQLWAGHALGRTLIGPMNNVLRMSREDILAFKQKKYIPANTVIALSGNVDHDACVTRLEQLLGAEQKRRLPSYKKVDKTTKQVAIGYETKKIEQAHFALGVRMFGRNDPRRYPMKLMSVILGENMSSRLFQIVREKHGMAYSVHSGVHLYDDTGALVIHAGLDRERCMSAVKLIMKELQRIKDKKVSARELKRAKDYACGQLQIGLESTSSQMMWSGGHLISMGHIRQPKTIMDSIHAVTTQSISKAAAQVLKKQRISMTLLMPEESKASKEQLYKLLEQFH